MVTEPMERAPSFQIQSGKGKVGPKRSSSRFQILLSSMGAEARGDHRQFGVDQGPAPWVAAKLDSGSEPREVALQRTSQVNLTRSRRVKLQREAQEHKDREKGKDLNMGSFFADLDTKKSDEEGDDEGDEGHKCVSERVEDKDDSVRPLIPLELALEHRGSEGSLDLRGVFDRTSGSRLVAESPDGGVYPMKARGAQQSSDTLNTTCTTLSSRPDALTTSRFGNVNFDPDAGNGDRDEGDRTELPLDQRSNGSHADARGWLPWPGQEDDHAEEDREEEERHGRDGSSDSSSDVRRGELIESFLSLSVFDTACDGQYDEHDSLRPWPQARAA